tara:strand:+ start:3109 stop:3327 length:219 start_codon:yes stop_codon:yes gene_type:complete
MRFIQSKDGSCDIIFQEEEIKLINNNKKLHLPAKTLKHFGNTMAKIIMDWNVNFNEDVKKMLTFHDTEIKGK